jgi:hypothetical protein
MAEELSRLSLADLFVARVRLDSHEAVAIVRELCRIAPPEAQRSPSPLTPGQVWLDAAGAVGVFPGSSVSVADLGGLLEVLLLAAREDGPKPIPGPLLYTMARATGQTDSPGFATASDLSNALARFDRPDRTAIVRALFARGAEAAAVRGDAAPVTESPPPEQEIIRAEFDDAPSEGPPRRTLRERTGLRPVWATTIAAAGLALGILAALATPALRWQPGGAERAPAREQTPVSGRSQREEAIKRESPAPIEQQPLAEYSESDAAAVAATAASVQRPEQLVDPDAVDVDAVFSPSFASNGTAVFFHTAGRAGSALKRLDKRADGDVLRFATIVDDGAKNYHVQPSPDGRAIAFDSDRDGVRGVYVAGPDGSGAVRVSGEGYAAVPRWSPDGRRLAFVRAEEDRSSVWNLWVLELRSRKTDRLTEHRYGQVWAGAWFPDGHRVGYSHEDRFIVLDTSTGESRIYASPTKGRLVRTPAVSPDGRWAMFQVAGDGGWVLDVESGSMRRVLDDWSAEEFTWSPDGRKVAFHSRRSGEWGLWQVAAK